MVNAVPQFTPMPDFDQEYDNSSSGNSVSNNQLPQQWELYAERIAPSLARQTGESIQEARRQLLTAFRPVPKREMNTAEMLKAMDWDDVTYDSYPTRSALSQSGIITKNGMAANPSTERLIANENGIPIYIDDEEIQDLAS